MNLNNIGKTAVVGIMLLIISLPIFIPVSDGFNDEMCKYVICDLKPVCLVIPLLFVLILALTPDENEKED